MVIDTSALIAILMGEPESQVFSRKIALDESPCISAVTLVETHLVLRKRARLIGLLEEFMRAAEIEIVPVDPTIAALARWASDHYGRGTKANLNFGDLFSYASAKKLRAPLLFKGDDFGATDIEAVRQP